MKTQVSAAVGFFFLLLSSFSVISSCEHSTQPIRYPFLIIENGYYEKVETTNSEGVAYAIGFDFYTVLDSVHWGGYSVQIGSNVYTMILYKLMPLKPGKIYSQVDTFKVNSTLGHNPVVTMQGYLPGSSESHDELEVEYILQQKRIR